MSDGPKPEQEILNKIDDLLKKSEDNGWNAAINACREMLPVHYSQAVRSLYRLPSSTKEG